MTDAAAGPGRWATASFRDPAGRVFASARRVIRVVEGSAAVDLAAILASPTARRFVEGGRLVGTRLLEPTEIDTLRREGELGDALRVEPDAVVVEHQPVAFPSYPHEWPAEMLEAAGSLTLDLAEALLPDGWGLKDATPYNVLFTGPVPVFVDLLSFERRAPGDPIWLAHAQFERTFLLPLLLARRFGVPLQQTFLVRRDGLEPEDVYLACAPLQRLVPPYLTLASLPTWLGRGRGQDDAGMYHRQALVDPDKARFVLASLYRRLRRVLGRVGRLGRRHSRWLDYATRRESYSAAQLEAKRAFVDRALAECRPQAVLDVGCNTGSFSTLAARRGARVVAVDSDPVVVGETWRRARDERLDILPLVIDLGRPSPGVGWRNRECPGFLVRARGAFDAVLMLAVLHHLVVTERVPLGEIVDLAADLTTDVLVIEFVAPDDPMFRRLARGRDGLFTDLTTARFEAAVGVRFDIVRSQRLEDANRWLYLLRRKPGLPNA
jgi:SAM-dependent methyltransferase